MREMLLVLLAAAAPVFSQNADPKALALLLNQQALDARSKGSAAGADRLTLEALTAAEESNDPISISTCLHNRAMVLRELRRYSEAEPLQRRVVSIMESLNAKPHHLAMGLQTLASLLFITGRPAEAEPLLRRAASFGTRNEAPFVASLVWNSFGEVLYALGQDREAESCFRNALAANVLIRSVSNDDVFQYTLVAGENKERLEALILNNQGLVFYRSGQLQQAEKCWRRSIGLYTKESNATASIGSPMANLGELLRFKKQFLEAADYLTQALSLFERTIGPESFRVALVTNLLANALMETGDLAQARRLYERALNLCIKIAGEQHAQTGVILSNLAELELRTGATSKAMELFSKSLSILEASLGPNHPTLIPTLTGQAALLRKLGRKRDAKIAESRWKSIQSLQGSPATISLEDLYAGR